MKRIGWIAALVIGLCIVVFVAWALNASPPEPVAYTKAISDPRVVIGSRDGFITIRPAAHEPAVGLLFYPGLRVTPSSYVAKLSTLAVSANVQVAIGRPPLNVAIFSIGQADAMRVALPGVTRWYVGGHSLGGAMACRYASKHFATLEGVVLLGTYCGADISNSSLRVLSVAAGNDGLFPPSKIAAARRELPNTAQMVQIPGMNHAQFGNYGAQAGDNASTIEDTAAGLALANAAATFFSRVAR